MKSGAPSSSEHDTMVYLLKLLSEACTASRHIIYKYTLHVNE